MLNLYLIIRREIAVEELVIRSLDGDKDAFTQLVKLIDVDLYRIANAKLEI